MEKDDRTRDGEGTPGWVKAFAVAGILLVVLVVVALATGGHGPGRHGPSGHPALEAPPGSAAQHSVLLP